MGRYVLFHPGGPASDRDLNRIRTFPRVDVLEEANHQVMLVDGPEQDLRSLVATLDGWSMEEEREYRMD